MTNEPAQPRRPGEDARNVAHQARRRWADEVLQALNEQNLSINAAAKAAGISPGRLQAWLNQDVEPSPRFMGDLARVIGRGHIHLLQLLEWLPTEMADAPLRLEATERLNEAVAEARRWMRSATRAIGLRGGSLVAGALLEASQDWKVTVRNSIRGHRYPVRYAIRVGFSHATGSEPEPSPARTSADRQEIERLIFDTMLRTSARWLPPERLAGQAWAPRPDLVMAVPSLCASRPRGLRPNLLVPPSVLVVGAPRTGGREVAALLARLLDWAYLDIRALAGEQYGLASDSSRDVVDRAVVASARRLLQDPIGVARQTVWSYRDPRPVLQTFREIGPDLPLVVLLRAPDSLLAQLATTPNDDGDSDLVEAAQNVVRRILESSRTPESYLILDVPESPPGGDDDEIDATFDSYVELAFQAASWLAEHHRGPNLAESGGMLGQLWERGLDHGR